MSDLPEGWFDDETMMITGLAARTRGFEKLYLPDTLSLTREGKAMAPAYLKCIVCYKVPLACLHMGCCNNLICKKCMEMVVISKATSIDLGVPGAAIPCPACTSTEWAKKLKMSQVQMYVDELEVECNICKAKGIFKDMRMAHNKCSNDDVGTKIPCVTYFSRIIHTAPVGRPLPKDKLPCFGKFMDNSHDAFRSETRLEAALTAGCIVLHHKDAAQALHMLGYTYIICQVLSEYTDNVNLMASACEALQHLVLHNRNETMLTNGHTMVAPGRIKLYCLIKPVMIKHKTERVLQTLACSALAMIAYDAESSDISTMMTIGTHFDVLDAMKEFPECGPLQEAGVYVLNRIVRGVNQSNIVAINATQAVQRITEAVAAFPANKKIQRHGAKALKILNPNVPQTSRRSEPKRSFHIPAFPFRRSNSGATSDTNSESTNSVWDADFPRGYGSIQSPEYTARFPDYDPHDRLRYSDLRYAARRGRNRNTRGNSGGMGMRSGSNLIDTGSVENWNTSIAQLSMSLDALGMSNGERASRSSSVPRRGSEPDTTTGMSEHSTARHGMRQGVRQGSLRATQSSTLQPAELSPIPTLNRMGSDRSLGRRHSVEAQRQLRPSRTSSNGP